MSVKLEDRLDEMLDALAAHGPKGLEEGLERFPASAELRPLLVAAARGRRSLSVRPSAQTRAKHLVMLTDAARAQAPQAIWEPERRRRPRRVLRVAYAVMALAAIALAPTAALAANAEPGDLLYGTKLATEQIRLALETDTARDVRLHLEFAGVRLSELSALIAEGRTDEIGAVMSNFTGHTGASEQGIAALEAAGESSSAFEATLSATLMHHIDILTGLSESADCDPDDPDAGAPQCKGLLNAIEKSGKVLDRVHPGRGPSTESGPPDEFPGRGNSPGEGNEVSEENKPESPGPPEGKGP